MVNDLPSVTKYSCPRTGAKLLLSNGAYCVADGSAYAVDKDIPQFLHFEPAEDDITVAQLNHLNELARKNGWESAVQNVYGAGASIVRYVTESSRASFIELLALTNDCDVLEIGPGLGQFTVPLARQAKSVWALEVVQGQAEFTAERCRQEGLSNVHVAVGGDNCRLPYSNETFDVVVVNLVLEWCAMRCLNEEIVDVQRRFLSETCRVLRPGGTLYLATKNRFALRQLIGKSDEHCYGIRFGSALPRWISQALLRLKGHKRPFGMLHSHNSLRAMMSSVGFSKIESFWATPEMRYPVEYVANDAQSIRNSRRKPGFIQGDGRVTALIMKFIPAPLVKHFTPGLAFLAKKS
jgi:ubiquinone/menaquinone biosynthesis C-methylase UbiE